VEVESGRLRLDIWNAAIYLIRGGGKVLRNEGGSGSEGGWGVNDYELLIISSARAVRGRKGGIDAAWLRGDQGSKRSSRGWNPIKGFPAQRESVTGVGRKRKTYKSRGKPAGSKRVVQGMKLQEGWSLVTAVW